MHDTMTAAKALVFSALATWAWAPTLVASGPHPRPQSQSQSHFLTVSHQQDGLLTVEFDASKPENGSLRLVGSTEAGFRPGWICSHGDVIYSMSRTRYPDDSSSSGGIFAFRDNDSIDHELVSIGSASSHGNGGVHCDVHPDGQLLAVTNIDGATLSTHSLAADGSIGETLNLFGYNITSPGPGGHAQDKSYPHQSIFDPSGQFLFVPDRGADEVYVYRVAAQGNNSLERIEDIIKVLPGTGPRHVAFNHVGGQTLIYLVGEIDNTVRVFTLDVEDTCDGPTPRVELVQTASTLGPGSDRTPPDNVRMASEIRVSNDGRFVYTSNRHTGSYDSDTLAIFAVRPGAAEPLHYVGQNETHGKIPRQFSLSPDAENRYVAVANQVSNNMVLFTRNAETGFLEDRVGMLTLGEFDESTQWGPKAVDWALS